MLEKIFIDPIQEDALITYKKEGYTFTDFVSGKPLATFNPTFSILMHFSAEEFSYLLHGWYTVVEPVKVNQWFNYDGRYRKIAQIDTRYIYLFHVEGEALEWSKVSKQKFYLYAKKVTHRWEELLLNLGRTYPAPQIGDIYLDKDGIHLLETMEDCFTKALPAWNNDKIIKYYPHEVGFKK